MIGAGGHREAIFFLGAGAAPITGETIPPPHAMAGSTSRSSSIVAQFSRNVPVRW